MMHYDFPTQQHNGTTLPAWLFYQQTSREAFISPAATFKPTSALENAPWQSLTSPKEAYKTKTLILDLNALIKGLKKDDLLAQIAWFRMQDVNVLLCIRRDVHNEFINCKDEDNLTPYLDHMGVFNPDSDYETIAERHRLGRDVTAVVDFEKSKQLYLCLHATTTHLASYSLNDEESGVRKENRGSPIFRTTYEVYIPSGVILGNEIMHLSNESFPLQYNSIAQNFKELLEHIPKFPKKLGTMCVALNSLLMA